MLHTSHLKIACATAILTILGLFFLACGGGSSTPNVSAAQAQAISQELFSVLGSALVSGLTPPGSQAKAAPRSLASAIPSHPAFTGSDCTTTATGTSCDIPIKYQGSCPQGGTIAVNGDFIFTTDNSGNGSDSSTLTVTPANCAVSDLTINGNPNVTVSMNFILQNNALGYPVMFSEKGGITFGPHPSGSCSLNVSVTVNSATSCTASGTVCGHSISGSC